MDRTSTAALSFLAAFALAEIIVLLAIAAFMIWVYWRIFAKAGYNGALSLLNLIPGVGGFICIIILAFGRWPVEDQLAMLQGRPASPTSPATPGASVMPTA